MDLAASNSRIFSATGCSDAATVVAGGGVIVSLACSLAGSTAGVAGAAAIGAGAGAGAAGTAAVSAGFSVSEGCAATDFSVSFEASGTEAVVSALKSLAVGGAISAGSGFGTAASIASSEALSFGDGDCAKADGAETVTPVTVGETVDSLTEITEGIAEGDLVQVTAFTPGAGNGTGGTGPSGTLPGGGTLPDGFELPEGFDPSQMGGGFPGGTTGGTR